MTKINFEETFEIYLFTESGAENNFSKLNEFLSFLKYNRVALPYKFSYVGSGDALIPELSLDENILMDFTPKSLTDKKELQFQEFLKEHHNRDLEKLYHKITTPSNLPESSSPQVKKICSLIKSLIFEGQFILLEKPEDDLDEESIALFISSLKDHIIRYRQNVFIFSYNLDLWMPHIHRHVKRKKDHGFCVQVADKNWLWKKEREQFYTPLKTTESPPKDLFFHLPKKKGGKKSAA